MSNLRPMTALILRHLKEENSITNVEAQAVYKCRSLSRRICDLKEAGHHIDREMKRDATGQRYARYIYRGVAQG